MGLTVLILLPHGEITGPEEGRWQSKGEVIFLTSYRGSTSQSWLPLRVPAADCNVFGCERLLPRCHRRLRLALGGDTHLEPEVREQETRCVDVQECVSEFISFITLEAAERCHMEKCKTIGGEDILYTMASLGFENYAETLKIHLVKLRQVRWVVICLLAFAFWQLHTHIL